MDRYLIAPVNHGLVNNLPSWQTPEDSFVLLNNAYNFRGRIIKRFGADFIAKTGINDLQINANNRLGIQVGTLFAGSVSGTVPGSIFQVGQAFIINGIQFTVVTAGSVQQMLRTDGIPGAATYDTTNGNFNITTVLEPNGTPVFFFPSTPVMGLTIYETGPIDNEPTYAFDQQFAYTFNGTQWIRSGTKVWHGNDSDFFWVANWEDNVTGDTVLFVTNFNASTPTAGANDDPIRTFGFPTNTWADFIPYFRPNGGAPQTGAFVSSCQMIVAFKGILVLLGTIENDGSGNTTYYKNRARYSFYGSPFARNAWYEPNQMDDGSGPPVVDNNNEAAGAGFVDAATEEAIVSCDFIKDRLIVYFDRSTWELAYTGNWEAPVTWQKLNAELGAQSTFSSVGFDQEILCIGATGVHSCNGSNVLRIDNDIPDEIFDVRFRSDGTKRIWGIRDYRAECVYWTIPEANENRSFIYNNKVLLYNYRNKTWAFNDDVITAFGYFEQQILGGEEWQDAHRTWAASHIRWDDGSEQPGYRKIIAGNHQGYIFLIESDPDFGRNAAAMQITNIVNTGSVVDEYLLELSLTIINHCITDGDYIALENIQGLAGITADNFIVQTEFVDANTVIALIDISGGNITGNYTGGGVATRVSNYGIATKDFNPYVSQGKNVYISKVDFALLKSNAELLVDYNPSNTPNLSMIEGADETGALIGTGVLEFAAYPADIAPLEQYQDRLWHSIYLQVQGNCIQMVMSMTDTMIRDQAIAWSYMELQGMILHTAPASDRIE